MNGRKAKQLRTLAGVNKQNRNSRHYEGIKHTLRTHKIEHPTKLNADGTKVIIGTYQTVTTRMGQGVRLLNKMFKKQFKAKQGMFTFT